MLFPPAQLASSGLLTEKYRPATTSQFIGLEKPKRWAARMIANPVDGAFIFLGASGMGKTTFALALAQEIGAQVHHISSQNCNVQAIQDVHLACQYLPGKGLRKHLVLVDEADQMSYAAQLALLSIIDRTNPAPDTIWVFTCNAVEKFEDRFLSRNLIIEFSKQGVSRDVSALLERVWAEESDGAPAPNFARIVKDAQNNIRTSLMELQREIMMS